MKQIIFFLLITISGMESAFAVSPGELLKRQKDLYQTHQWAAFFGGAYFIRVKGHAKIQDASLAMELMALSRHCQWATVFRLTEGIAVKRYPLSSEAVSVIRMKSEYKKFEKDLRVARPGFFARLKARREMWPVNNQMLAKMTSPDELRMKVETRCE